MTIRLKYTVTAKRTEPNPSRIPTAVESAATPAECELGMPPVSTMRRKLSRRSHKLERTNLKSCTRKPHVTAIHSGLGVRGRVRASAISASPGLDQVDQRRPPGPGARGQAAGHEAAFRAQPRQLGARRREPRGARIRRL